MQIGILGPLEVRDGGRVVEIRGARLRALLIRLALDPGRVVGVQALAASLWEGDDLTDEVNALQSLVSRLRRSLPDPSLLESLPSGYRLTVSSDDVDAHCFSRLARTGHDALMAGDHSRAAETLREALTLWRGTALADVVEAPYAAAEQARLEGLRLTAREDLLEAELALGEHHAAVPELEALAAAHPLRERLRGLQMMALYAAGRQAEALAVYEDARHLLSEDLGVDPSAELQATHLAVLRGELPGPRATSPHRQAGRAQLTSFIGRDADLRALEAQLTENRLVTLVGPGGAGKTRLANETADVVAERFPGGVWVAALAPLDEPRDLAQSVAGVLGLRERTLSTGTTSARDAMSRISDAFAGAPTLLVLDNCEHLIEAAADLADELLQRCPQLHVLATSREPLGIVGEVLVPVLPLDRPDAGSTPDDAVKTAAVRLFADRAASVQPGFVVDGSNVDAVAEICRRLDGLPLAIELAAARLRTMGVAQVAARLDDRFLLLTGGSRTALPRHRTLRAVVSWSWDLLDDAERLLAERLAVFSGGVTPESAFAVAGLGTPHEVLDLLSALVDKSLLQLVDADEPRYRMLETIREFGVERLAEREELGAARRAHATYFRDLGEEADGHVRTGEQLPWIRHLRAERDNCSAALRFAIDTGDADTAYRLCASLLSFWTMQGSHEEALAWTMAVAELPPDGADLVARAVVLAGQALSAGVSELPLPRPKEELEAAVDAAGGETAHPILSLVGPILALVSRNDEHMAAAIDRGLRTEDPWAHATLLLLRAMSQQNVGNQEAMNADIAEGRALFTQIGDRWGRGMTLMIEGEMHVFADDVEASMAAYTEAEELLIELGADEDVIQAGFRIALLLAQTGRIAEATAQVERMAQLCDRSSLSRLRLYVTLGQGSVAAASGDLTEARKRLEEALAAIAGGAVTPPQMRTVALSALGMVEAAEGSLDLAGALHREAYALGLGVHDLPCAAIAVTGLADVALRRGDPADAARLLGLSASLRGLQDHGPGDTRRIAKAARAGLGDATYDEIYAAAAGLGHERAEAELVALGAAPVRPQGERGEDREDHRS
jgi:predicted ATPase/DNA-binding SARP family transcriptional activator